MTRRRPERSPTERVVPGPIAESPDQEQRIAAADQLDRLPGPLISASRAENRARRSTRHREVEAGPGRAAAPQRLLRSAAPPPPPARRSARATALARPARSPSASENATATKFTELLMRRRPRTGARSARPACRPRAGSRRPARALRLRLPARSSRPPATTRRSPARAPRHVATGHRAEHQDIDTPERNSNSRRSQPGRVAPVTAHAPGRARERAPRSGHGREQCEHGDRPKPSRRGWNSPASRPGRGLDQAWAELSAPGLMGVHRSSASIQAAVVRRRWRVGRRGDKTGSTARVRRLAAGWCRSADARSPRAARRGVAAPEPVDHGRARFRIHRANLSDLAGGLLADVPRRERRRSF